jgi:dipeptidyl aminopeptidase/acylaminoacyl peptidase
MQAITRSKGKMSEPKTAPYGSWKSPITSDLIVSATIGLGFVAPDGEDLYWLEVRPTEGGRNVLVRRRPSGAVEDVTPPPFNVRTRVHEYGGGACLVRDGVVYFSNFGDQRLYRQEVGAEPRPLTRLDGMRYADAVLDGPRGRLICVREEHTGSGEAVNTIVSIDVETGAEEVLVSGNDFYSFPRLSPDGGHLVWLAWNHPNMPWDGTELWLGRLDGAGAIADARKVAGGQEESVLQPEWSPDGRLYFVSDPTGWWNLYRLNADSAEPVLEMEAEFGRPQWTFGTVTYAFESPQRIVCSYTRQGTWRLGLLDITSGELTPVESRFTDIAAIKASAGRAFFIGASAAEPRSIIRLDLATGEEQVLKRSTDLEMEPGYLSMPEPVEFRTEGGLTAHALFYPPRNRDFRGPPGEKPPLIVHSHGGPTGATSPAFNLSLQYWTSRGFAIVDVNYGGSTGYGREYRERLKGWWGVVDVEDCVNAALHLVKQGLVDGDRLAIAGGSAGGYTTLCALAFRTEFKAGASHFGVGDLEALAKETHKFESRYLDSLIGPYSERRDLYLERSPIHNVHGLDCPTIFFQGLEDRIVPPNQAESMVEALKQKGVPVAYVAFEGEQHGFRKAENIRRSLDAELYFYSRIFGFEPADPVEPVAIENL